MASRLVKFKPFLFIFLLLAAAVVAGVIISQIKVLKSSGAGLDKKVISPVPSPPKKEKIDFVLGNLLYPGSETIRLDGNRIYLKSPDSPETITSWYQERIGRMNLGINNFVRTSANGEVVNLLNAADERGKVRVEIDRNASDSRTNINVTINGF